MNKMRFTATALAAVLALGNVAALTGCVATAPHQQAPNNWEIHSRIREASERIDRNYARGALSAGEARRLRHELEDIRITEARMRRDGVLDRREREVLDAKLDRLSRDISRDVRR